jgi:hypothetical protein
MNVAISCLLGAWLFGVAANGTAQTADEAKRALTARGDLDEIRWSDPARGAAFRAGIVGALEEGVEVQRGAVRRVIPYEQIGGIKFGISMGERQLVAEAKIESISALRVFWEARRRTIRVSGSNAGDFGLALARALRQAESGGEALSIAREIEAEDNDPERRERARLEGDTLMFLQTMRTDAPDEIEKKAWSMIEAANETNPDLMLLVTGYLMKKEFERLKFIESENPRWTEDDEVKPERDRHYHRALDLALYPSLFHPRREREAAEGLWQASEVYQYTRELPREIGVLQDLVALYSAQPQAAEARQRLIPLLAKVAAVGPVSDSGGVEEKPKEAAAKEPPPPPKRYNLFED